MKSYKPISFIIALIAVAAIITNSNAVLSVNAKKIEKFKVSTQIVQNKVSKQVDIIKEEKRQEEIKIKRIETEAAQQRQMEEEKYYVSEIPLSKDLQKLTYDKCEAYGVDYNLVLAVMKRESGYNINCISQNINGTYDSGIMQINSCHKKAISESYGEVDILDPDTNISIGIDMISSLVEKYGERGGLMAYNMGIGGYQNAIKNGIYKTEYSETILTYKSQIEEMHKGGT